MTEDWRAPITLFLQGFYHPTDINEAKRLGGVNDNVARISGDAEGGKPAAAQGSAPASKTPVPTVNATAEYFVAGTVTLSPELKDKVKPDDAVFIYAHL